MQTTINMETVKVEKWLNWLSCFGATKNDGVTRLLYDDSWKTAQLALKEKMVDVGLQASFDSIGNLFGRLEGTEIKEKTILTGSHIDTVVDGGKYDGAYGVIASLLAVKYLYEHYGFPKKTIEVVSLCEEEGSRFPLAFWGSGSITGKYKLEDSKELKDASSIPFHTAMELAGFPPSNQSAARDDIDSFIEVHIEQGAVLEKEKQSVGIVTHIVGQRRFNIKIIGESNHAGTTPMSYRKDSMHIASEFIAYAMNKVKEIEESLVATVGKLTVSPNVPNVIPNEVVFTLDVRHHQEDILDQYCAKIFSYFESICLEKGAGLDISQWVNVKPVKMDENLIDTADYVLQGLSLPYKKMISGAGHDSQMFGTFCPTALLFVPSQKGISHSPLEFTKIEDLKNGVIVLIKLLHKLAY
ncbi:allantoate deiminase [Niallia nealsonii]|uniref:Allantoate amidohydrolase n=1 Tax=Niallia nealsonii TaxID=115979 RepID=A0A2N0YXQ5_9BACI|nr:allantoate deiminase [Niallia nealsonii]PKG22039.1 allantoate amidohydrolase [Niallia nealsonii]